MAVKRVPNYTIPNQRVYISRVIVDVSYHNQGIGAKIVDHLLTVAKEKGFSEASIGVDVIMQHAICTNKKWTSRRCCIKVKMKPGNI